MNDDTGQFVISIVGLAALITLILFFFLSAAILLPFIALGFALFGGVYYYYHSPQYLEHKAREHTHALYQEALKHYTAQDPHVLAAEIISAIPETPLALEIGRVAVEIIEQENIAAVPRPPLICNSIEGARYRDKLSKVTEFPSPDRAKEILVKAFTGFVQALPSLPEDGRFTVPLVTLVKSPGEAIEALVLPLYDEKGLFTSLKNKLDSNYNQTSGGPNKPPILPSDYKGDNIAHVYLKETPFLPLLDARVPFAIPRSVRFEHCIITGGSGHGKTQLLQNLILADLHADDSPCVVVVDSQGEMLQNIARLELFKERKIIILDPRDNPALNIFDINHQRIARYGEAEQEQVLNHTLETFSYLFNSLLGADLTVRQSVLFNYLIKLMLMLPKSLERNATLLDLMNLMDDPKPYRPAIDALDPIPRAFFVNDFPTKQYDQTKEQIRYRLQAIIGNQTLARLFLAPRNTIDFFAELNRSGNVVLIDTSKAYLGAKNSSYLGRIATTLILQAVLERGAISGYKQPVHLYIDEAGEYFDKSVDVFLTEARKQHAGITFAHQYLNQMTPELRASVAANTSIKIAGGLSNQDARAIASDMRSEPDFILAQPKLSFACYIRGHTPRAIALSVPYGALENEPRMSDDEYQLLRQRNRAALSPDDPEPDPTPPPSGPRDDGGIDDIDTRAT